MSWRVWARRAPSPHRPAPARNNTGYNEIFGGHGGKSGANITLKNNWFVCAADTVHSTLVLQQWNRTTVSNNSFVGPIAASGIGSYDWSNNRYYKSTPPHVSRRPAPAPPR